MPTIIEPAATRAIPVSPRQPLRMRSDTATDWWMRVVVTGSEAWTQINPAGTDVSTLVWETPSTVTRRKVFDRIQIQVNTTTAPSTGDTGGLHLNLCEGPVAGLWISDQIRNEAMEEPPLRPWEGEDDDPPLGVPLYMPAANRDRLGTVLCETVSEPGGPGNLITSFRPGVYVDNAGKLGVRTPFMNDVRGLGPFPAVAASYHGGLYFEHDFGKSRNLGLTRVLFQDGTTSDVAVVRGDGRRNTYRWNGASFDAAVGLRNSLTSSGGVFEETTPSGRIYRYDSAGRLQRVVDRQGQTAYYAYDVNNRLQKIDGLPSANAVGLVPYLAYDGSGLLERLVFEDAATPANSRASYFTYDGNKNLLRIVGPEACITYFEYQTAQYLTAITDPEGYRWYFRYDANNRVSRIDDARGRATYFFWDTATPLGVVKDRAGKQTYFRYNAFGLPTQVSNPGTMGDYYLYDNDGNLVHSRNRLSNKWYFQYDSRGNRISVTDPLLGRSYFAYDATDLLRSYTDPLLRATSLDYDGSRNRTKLIDPLGNTTYYEYESTGLLRQRKDRRKAMSYFVYDPRGNVTYFNDDLGQATYFQYNSANERTATKDPLGRLSYLVYDKRGRVVTAISPIDGWSYFAFDSRCNLVQEVDALGRYTYHKYDGNQNRIQTLSPPAQDGVRTKTYFGYDVEDRVYYQFDGRNLSTYFFYDNLGRRQKVQDAYGNLSYFAYDAAHQLERQTNPLGNPTYFQYDPTGRQNRQLNAWFNVTYFGFNLAGEQVVTVDPRGNGTYFEYDPRGWQRQTKSQIGAINYFAFDEEGNRERAVDPRGFTTYFTYDKLGRLTHTKDHLLGVTYTGYDRAGQAILRLDELGYPTYMGYDLAGRNQTTLDPAGLFTYLQYDKVGNLLGQVIDQGWGWAPWGSSPWGGERAATYFQYDGLNRRVVTIDPYNRYSYTDYDRNNNVYLQIDERRVATYFLYDRLNRRTHTADGVHFAKTYMGYDAVGNSVVSIDQQGAPSYVTYDRLNRAYYQFDLAAGLKTYHTYDAAGNRTAQHVVVGSVLRSSYFQYDRVNRVLRQIAADGGSTYFGYDLAGNQTLVTDPVGRPTYTAYDQLNRTYCRYDAQLNKTYWSYDARSSAVREIDPEGRAAYMGYDPARRLFHQSNALGEFSYFFYDARGARTHVLNPRGYSTYFRFDLLGRNTHRENALGGVAYMGYDEVGNQVLSEGPEETNFLGLYYQASSLLKKVEQDGTDDTTVVSGESMGSVSTDLNAPGGKLYWVSGDLIRRGNLDGTGKETVYDFSATGTPQALRVDPNGQRLYFSAQATGVIRSVKTDGTDLQTVVTPGSLVNFLDLHPAAGHVYYTRYSSGDVRRVDFAGTNDQAIVSSLTEPNAIALDLVNRKVYWTEWTPKTIKRANLDGSGTETVLTVSAGVAGLAVDPIRGLLFWVESNALKRASLDGTGTTTLVASSAVGDVALSVPVRVSLSTFDGLRRVTQVRDALMNLAYMEYDNRSSMTRRVDADGRSTFMGYDSARRMIRQNHTTPVAGETETSPSYYVYNAASEVTIVDDRLAGLGVSYFDYDKVGRVTKKTTRAGAVYHGYDASGQRTWLMDPRLVQSYYVYDTAGRNTAVESAAGRTAYFHYDKAGLETRKRGPANENLAYLSYDKAGRLSELVNRSSAGAVVTYFLYQRNQNGAPTRVTHEDGTFTYYQYDALDRLTQEHRVTNPTVYGFQYEYDQASRRTSRYDLASDSQVSYSLDTRGLLRQEYEPDVDITTYEWDAAQRLVTRTGLTTATSYAHDQRDQVKDFTLEGFGSGTNHQFHYTGLGERVVMVGGVGGTTPTYLAYDGGRLVTERDQGGTTYQALRWSPKSEVVDALDLEVGSSKAPVTDAQGSVGRLPGVAGGRIYDAFGVEWASSLASNTRAAFLPGAFLRLNSVPYQIGLTRGGLYLASGALLLVGSSEGLLQLGQAAPPPVGPQPPPWVDNRLVFVVKGGWDRWGVQRQEKPRSPEAEGEPVPRRKPGGSFTLLPDGRVVPNGPDGKPIDPLEPPPGPAPRIEFPDFPEPAPVPPLPPFGNAWDPIPAPQAVCTVQVWCDNNGLNHCSIVYMQLEEGGRASMQGKGLWYNGYPDWKTGMLEGTRANFNLSRPITTVLRGADGSVLSLELTCSKCSMPGTLQALDRAFDRFDSYYHYALLGPNSNSFASWLWEAACPDKTSVSAIGWGTPPPSFNKTLRVWSMNPVPGSGQVLGDPPYRRISWPDGK